MAFSYRIPCVECGVERVVVISGDEAMADNLADKERQHGMCKACGDEPRPTVEELLRGII